MSESSSRLKILLAQLPHPSNRDRNVPLAAGYLKASAYRYGLLEEVNIEILDPDLSDYSGCQKLIDSINSKEPDVVGFSLYLWNVKRTLYIIKKIKAKLPYLKILVGGPEVTRDSTYILSNPNIDIAILGEGEITFVEVIKRLLHGRPKIDEISGICYRKNGNIVANRPRKRIVDIELIPSPYLLGFIDPRKYREMMLFTMRGCMLGCTYCSWTARGQLRAFAMERLRKELTLAKETGEKILISIVDSAFNASPVFVEFCKMAQEINEDNTLKFFCFVQADLIDEEAARLLKESNFASVEVGLQSTNREVLTKINRTVNVSQFLRGVNFLRKKGIWILVDTIIGLPGDSLKTFEETMEFISHNRLEPILFNLSLGHGAKLSRYPEKFGAKVQTSPPFYVLETSAFTRQELEKALNRYKDYSADLDKMLNLDYPSIISNSHFRDHHNSCNDISYLQNLDHPISNIILKMDAPPKASTKVDKIAKIISQKAGSNISIIYLDNGKNLLNYLGLLETLLIQISSKNPYITWDLFLETEGYELSQALLEKILSFIHKPKVFLDYRDELFPKNLSCVRRKSINIFALLPYNDGRKGVQVNESSCIRTGTIIGTVAIQDQVREFFKARGSGFLIDFPVESDVNFIRETMGLLYEKNQMGKSVFFKDWVLQRLWEQEFLKITPSIQAPHYDLIIEPDMSFFVKFLDENELLWDAITKWKMLNSEYSDADIEKVIIDKIASKFSAGDKTDNISIGG